jgi:hypothetical protein
VDVVIGRLGREVSAKDGATAIVIVSGINKYFLNINLDIVLFFF